MEELIELFNQSLNENLLLMVISNPYDKTKGFKIKIRPVKIKGRVLFQQTTYIDTKVFHENFETDQMKLRLLQLLKENYKQAVVETNSYTATVLVSKKGKITIKKKNKPQNKNTDMSQNLEKGDSARLDHNRTKEYILKDGEIVDFLVGLGVQTPDGKITKQRYDKFKQINRFLEFIEDILDKLPNDRTVRIIDFGCGKSYLTFAMYYYLHVHGKRDISVTGLDLKKDVIVKCNELAAKLGYQGLNFEVGDIKSYEGANEVDMVVSLHACDTATDYAIYKAIKWGSKVILCVPCCQHEVNKQIKSREFAPILKYGLIKERMSALLTDAYRANLLEQAGYDTQILEFIDMEHTPKNILIRAVKQNKIKPVKANGDIGEIMDRLDLNPTLGRLLKDND